MQQKPTPRIVRLISITMMVTLADPVFAGIVMTTTPLIRQDDATIADQESGARTAEIEGWIEQLSESSLTKRRQAKEALVEADSAAIPLLAKAALSDNRDWIVYSLEVLGTLCEKSPNEETRKAARVTLQMLAESQQPSTAERAKQMLGTNKDTGIEAFPGWDDPNSGFGGGGGGNRSVSVSSINGMKTIRIEEAGRVTTFRDEPRGAIRVTIQEGEEKEEFVVKNIEALKKKDASASALYEQHSNGVGGGFGGMAFAGGFPNFGNPMNIPNNPMGPLGQANGNAMANGIAIGPGVNGGNLLEQAEETAAIQNAGPEFMIQQLDELKRRLADNPEMTRILDSQIKQLRQK